MLVVALVALEALAGARVMLRLFRSAGGTRIGPGTPPDAQTFAVVVPVLDEALRLGPCLTALLASRGVTEIVVVDGGSKDGTRELVHDVAARDARVRLVEAPLAPPGWNGKAWNLEAGLRAVETTWLVTVDADVRVGPELISEAVARATRDGLTAISIATSQQLADTGSALLHPALLTTLVYRAGLPNVATGDPRAVQANGQVFVARRDALVEADAFRAARASRCEDVTAARALASAGGRIGFYEGDAVVRMYDSWRDCAANWPRSLTLRDRFVPAARVWAALVEVLFAQALPLPTLLALLLLGTAVPEAAAVRAVALALVMMRVGVLAGTRRAYPGVSPAYWLSPLLDLPAVALLARSALRRRHVWRGRALVDERSA